MAWGFGSEDLRAFKLLAVMVVVYGAMSWGVYHIVHMKHIRPLGLDAPLKQFSEARAVEHVRRLTLHGRQEGQPGLDMAAEYIKNQLEEIARRAGPQYKVEVEDTLVSGSFNMIFLRHSISLGYRNHKNVVMRISSNDSKDNDPSVLVNGHFDSPLGSPGAGDCGSCVASMLEVARQIIDSNWVPPQPVIFLFNGAEELFLLGSHGFVKTHKWRHSVGAFINIEASGIGGFDLVCQSGPGSWPSIVYAKAVVHPTATSAAQDVFGIIPGDTDYRIFAEDFGDIPGLDIIFVLGELVHGGAQTWQYAGSWRQSIQLAESIFKLLRASNTEGRALTALNGTMSKSAIYFDYLTLFMVLYSRRAAFFLHSLPLVIFLLMPIFLHFREGSAICFAALADSVKGMIFHTASVILAIVVPIFFAVFRLLFSSFAMNWFAYPFVAFLMFVPCSLVGLLMPKAMWGFFPLSQESKSLGIREEVLSEEAHFWGAFGLYGFITMSYLLAGLGGGFLTFMISAFMLLAWFTYRLSCQLFGNRAVSSLAGYVIPLLPSIIYAIYFGGFLVQFLIEKTGMMGSLPQPYGFFIPDIVVAATIGVVTGWCVGPLIPVLGRSLARSSIMQFLLQIGIISLALSSGLFPYTVDAPKRVVLQHTIVTHGGTDMLESSYDFSILDANSLAFLFKHSPEAAKALEISPDFSFEAASQADMSSLVALFPVSFLFAGRLKFPAPSDDIFKHYHYMPRLHLNGRTTASGGTRAIYLELDLGSLEEIWVAALNITGPLSNWSFADNRLPAPEKINGGPPSYICRLSGRGHENWTFWLEANSSEALRVDVAVVDQYLMDDTKKLKSLFPSWADLVTFTTYFSSYSF